MDMNGIGEPVKVWTNPGVSKSVLVSHPQTTDAFNSYTLGLQWQFNHNPVNTHWSLNAVSYTHLDVYKRQNNG